MDYEQNTLDNLADMNYLIRLEEISKKARPTVEKDLKTNTKFAKEMMDNYAKLYNRPIEFIDPETGIIKQRKYQQPSGDVPQLETLSKDLIEILKPDEQLINKNKEEIKRLSELIIDINEFVISKQPETYKLYLEEKDLLNNKLEKIEEIKQYLQSSRKSQKDKKPYKNKLQELETLREDVKKKQIEVQNLEQNKIFNVKGDAVNGDEFQKIILSEIAILKSENEMEQDKEDYYLAEKERIRKKNKELVVKHQELLNTLNSGAFKMEQAQGESEQDYLDRLEATASTPYTENLYFNSKIKLTEEFKKKFKDVTRNNTLIESIFNSLNEDDRFLVVKFWEEIKRKLLKIYGFNNNNVEVDDYLDTIQQYLNQGEKGIEKGTEQTKEPLRKEYRGEIVEEEPEEPTDSDLELMDDIYNEIYNNDDSKIDEGRDFSAEMEADLLENIGENKEEKTKNLEIIQEDNILMVHSKKTGRNIFIKLGVLSYPQGQRNLILISLSNNEGSFNVLIAPKKNIHIANNIKNNVINFNQLEKILGLTTNEILTQLFDIKGMQNDFTNEAFENLKNKFTLESKKRTVGRRDYAVSNNLIGWGIKNKEIPKEVNFGNVKILLNKLYYKNLLSVKSHKNGNIYGFPVYKVSEQFVENIMKLLNNDKIKKHDLNLLSENERDIYDRLLKLAKLNKQHDNNIDNSIEQVKKRVELLEGEINAGNNNNSLLQELTELLLKLVNFGVITSNQFKKHIELIKHDFFN